MTHKTDEEGEDNSRVGFQVLMETPAIRNAEGAIVEADLQLAKDNYSMATWFVWIQQGNLYDPAEMRSLLERANALTEDSLALFE